MLTTASLPLLLLLILAAASFAQNGTPLLGQRPTAHGDDACSLQAATITCACRPGKEVLNLTASSMAGSGGAEALEVTGCSSVTLSFPPLQQLYSLLVRHCGGATFHNATRLLRHLELVNVSQAAFQGPTFQGTELETVLLDGVRATTLPSGAFANLNKIQNVTFRDVHFNAVQQGAVELNMVNNSELTIVGSSLLGVEKSGIVVRGVTNFTLHDSELTTVADNGLQLDAAGPVSISDSHLQTAGPIKLALKSGSPFRFVDNGWRNSSLLDLAQQIMFSGAEVTATGNAFHCACDATLDALVARPEAGPLLESNWCDEGLCGAPVSMRVLRSCGNQTELQAACKTAMPYTTTTTTTTTTPGKSSTPAGVTGSPRSAKPPSPDTKNTATTIAVSVTTALLLTVPAAAVRAL